MGDNYFGEQLNFTSEENLPSNLIKSLQFIQAKLSPGEGRTPPKVTLLTVDLTKAGDIIKSG